MNPMTGEIHHLSDEEIKALERESGKIIYREKSRQQGRLASIEKKLVSLTTDEAEKLDPLTKRERKGWMRNQPCPCGSGNKFKKCCWSKFK